MPAAKTLRIRSALPDVAISRPARAMIEALNAELVRKPRQLIRCAACQHAVTSSSEKIAMQSTHVHRFMNPAGMAFEVACFSRALGCIVAGDATFDFTWFAGYAWQYALCENCGEHLGWHYVSVGNSSFFGLIVNKLCL
jgi:hypothetical protein